LDLLGYKKHEDGSDELVVVELKSRPLEKDDVFQAYEYKLFLERTIYGLGMMYPTVKAVLIGTDINNINYRTMYLSYELFVDIYSIGFGNTFNELELSGKWHFAKNYDDVMQEKTDSMISNGRYINLIKYCCNVNNFGIRIN